jgi:hypothetical protein
MREHPNGNTVIFTLKLAARLRVDYTVWALRGHLDTRLDRWEIYYTSTPSRSVFAGPLMTRPNRS